MATPQVRNLGTPGGNLNQRPRCWYYRHPLRVCLKRSGDRCFIVHPSDTAVALTTPNSTVTIASDHGERDIPISNYFVGPDVDIRRENVLVPGELLTAATLPTPPGGQRSV